MATVDGYKRAMSFTGSCVLKFLMVADLIGAAMALGPNAGRRFRRLLKAPPSYGRQSRRQLPNILTFALLVIWSLVFRNGLFRSRPAGNRSMISVSMEF